MTGRLLSENCGDNWLSGMRVCSLSLPYSPSTTSRGWKSIRSWKQVCGDFISYNRVVRLLSFLGFLFAWKMYLISEVKPEKETDCSTPPISATFWTILITWQFENCGNQPLSITWHPRGVELSQHVYFVECVPVFPPLAICQNRLKRCEILSSCHVLIDFISKYIT